MEISTQAIIIITRGLFLVHHHIKDDNEMKQSTHMNNANDYNSSLIFVTSNAVAF